MPFTRTPGGLAEKWRFYQVPTVWVEGPTDIYFYEPMLDSMPYRIEPFHGNENASSLVCALIENDYPYLIILDGDYSILNPAPPPHPWVIVLDRYSFENFLWERDPVNRACLRHARCGDDKDIAGREMDAAAQHLEKELLYAVALDVAARRSGSSVEVLPEHIDQLTRDSVRPDVDPAKVAELVASVESRLAPKAIRKAQADIKKFRHKRCFTHLLKGHMVLGVLRRVFIQAAARESGGKAHLPNDALTQLLAEMVWRQCKSKDHLKLKRKIRAILRKLLPSYPKSVAPVRGKQEDGNAQGDPK